MALSRMDGKPRPASFNGLCTPCVEKLGRRPMACRMALLSMPYMAVICLSLNTPRCVAWYLDFRGCSTTRGLRDGLILRLARAFASFFYIFSDVGEVFSEVHHGVDMDPQHLVGFVRWEEFDVSTIRKSDGVYLFLEQGSVLLVERVSMGP